MAAWCLFTQSLNSWKTGGPQDLHEARGLARKAVDLGRGDAVALTRGGHLLGHFDRDLDTGIYFLDQALGLDPSLASAWFLGGFLRLFRGEPDEAIGRFERAMRLSPLDSEMFRMKTGTALAHLVSGRFDEAAAWAAKGVRDAPALALPGSIAAASQALAGRQDESERAVQRLLAANPTFRASILRTWFPFRRPEHAALVADGLRRAGLPE